MEILRYPKKGRFSNEGVVVSWEKLEGDSVRKGDILLVVDSVGLLLEIESASEGVLLKTLAEIGGPVTPGQSLAIVGGKDDDVSKAASYMDSLPSPQKEVASPAKAKSGPSFTAAPKQLAQKSDAVIKEENEDVMTTQSGSPDNVIPILMPQAGQSMEEGTILSWKIKGGDIIQVGQVIMEIETDKATMEVEATDAGQVVRIVAKEGDIVEVKKPVAFIAKSPEDVDAFLDAATPSPASAEKVAATASTVAAPSAPAEQTPVPASAAPEVSMNQGEVVPVLMPQAGQSMEEGTILSWKVKEGDVIEVGQVIMEIETDKATMEVEAVDAGRIAKIVSNEGDIVEVKKPVAYLAEEGVDVDAYIAGGGSVAPAAAAPVAPTQPAAAPASAPAQKTAAQVSESGRVKASPAARKAARQKGIDLNSVSAGSGPGGRILSTDVEQADVIPTEVQIHPLSKMRRAIANNLLYSKQNVPHFYAKKTIDAGLLFATYRTTKEQFKCSVNDFVTKACAVAIRQYPAFRSQYKNTEIHENPAVNIGIAVGTDEGLTVPVVLNADRMNLEQLASQTRHVVESARNGKLEGFGHGVFTITNLGMFGCEEFSAIINPPESAILAVGAIREGIVVKDGAIRPTRLMTMTLSVDHRVVDGVLAAQFLNTVQELLENPERLLT